MVKMLLKIASEVVSKHVSKSGLFR